MIDQFRIPDTAIKYILFQRTEYLRLPRTFAYRLIERLFPLFVYNHAVAVEAFYSKSRVIKLYRKDMLKEYLSIKPFLPNRCARMLDIGCGVSGISYFIYRHYSPNPVHLYLLDKTHVEPCVYYMFQPNGAFYNSLSVAKTLLTGSGIQEEFVHLVEATDHNDIDLTCKIDLVISLISWGFHYPLETYLDRVLELLSESGTIILDIRKNTGQLEKLEKKISKMATAKEAEKYIRVVCWK